MMRTVLRAATAAVAVLAVLAGASLAVRGQSGARNGEWPTYGGELANTRYSPLDQITRDNFKNLEVAWRFKTDNLGPRLETNLQSTPLMVKGALDSIAGAPRAVVRLGLGGRGACVRRRGALRAVCAAGRELRWMHSEDEGQRGPSAPRHLSGRGLAYW